MKNLASSIQESLGKQLMVHGYDLIDLTPIPVKADPLVKFQTLQEILGEFSNSESSNQTISYLIQIRPRQAQEEVRPDPGSKPTIEAIYLPNGKLNISYLQKNGDLLFSAGEYGLAKNVFNTILMSGERSGSALYWIGRCFEAEGKLDEAILKFEESITYHPTLEAYQSLSAIFIQKKKDRQAAEILERAINLKDITGELRLQLHKAAGNCWLRSEKFDLAEEHYKKALEIDSLSDSVHSNLGALYLQLGKNVLARGCFWEALAVNPKNERALSGMGTCLVAEGDAKGAHDYFAKSLAINLNNPTAIYYLVKCAYEIRSYAAAARIVEEYIQIAPVNANLLYSLAGLQYHLGKMKSSRRTALRILDLQQNHSGAMDLLKMISQYENVSEG